MRATQIDRCHLAMLALLSLPALAASRAGGPASGADPRGHLTEVSAAVAHQLERAAAPALPQRISAWVAPGLGRQVVDDFEAPAWPDRNRWVALVDLVSQQAPQYLAAPRDCRAASGGRSLWSVGGGAAGAALACGQPAPRSRQTSSVLALDLTAIGGAATASLTMDIFADAAPTEGLLLSVLVFDPSRLDVERHLVFSATGHSVDWSRDVKVDITDLKDRFDPSWHADLRGQLAYLEFLFLSDDSAPAGQGIFVDNVAVESAAPPPVIVTPVPTVTPTVVERTEDCTTEPDCRVLQVWSYIDYRCDRRFQPGVDERVVTMPRLDVNNGGQLLGTHLDKRGYASFRLLTSPGAVVELELPPKTSMCPGSPNPADLQAKNFARYGVTTLEMRLQRTK
jgi:hypothetical protein